MNLNNIGTVEAARYLELPYTDFISYVNRGLICYTMEYGGKITNPLERFFSRKELLRFKKEVLDLQGDSLTHKILDTTLDYIKL